jgi:hypothetical protein
MSAFDGGPDDGKPGGGGRRAATRSTITRQPRAVFVYLPIGQRASFN